MSFLSLQTVCKLCLRSSVFSTFFSGGTSTGFRHSVTLLDTLIKTIQFVLTGKANPDNKNENRVSVATLKNIT